jgi:hypothetical protein
MRLAEAMRTLARRRRASAVAWSSACLPGFGAQASMRICRPTRNKLQFQMRVCGVSGVCRRLCLIVHRRRHPSVICSACTRSATPSSSPRWCTHSCERWVYRATETMVGTRGGIRHGGAGHWPPGPPAQMVNATLAAAPPDVSVDARPAYWCVVGVAPEPRLWNHVRHDWRPCGWDLVDRRRWVKFRHRVTRLRAPTGRRARSPCHRRPARETGTPRRKSRSSTASTSASPSRRSYDGNSGERARSWSPVASRCWIRCGS